MRVTQIAIYFVIENKFWTQDIQLFVNEEDVLWINEAHRQSPRNGDNVEGNKRSI